MEIEETNFYKFAWYFIYGLSIKWNHIYLHREISMITASRRQSFPSCRDTYPWQRARRADVHVALVANDGVGQRTVCRLAT